MAYLYQPLNKGQKEIRVLFNIHSHSTSKGDPLQCKVENYSLLSNPPPLYAAISYSWGTSIAAEEIILDGFSINIPSSAAAVLRFAFNTEDESVPVWVDAVCINQSDKEEVGHQVGLMRDVYSKADHVLVWLGESDATTEKALKSIDNIVTQCRQSTQDLQDLDQTLWGGTGAARWYLYSDDALPTSSDWPSLYTFFSAHWFTRLWPVQEVCLAKEARCFRGQHTVRWSDVALAARWLYYRKYWNAGGARSRGIDCAAEIFDNMQGINGLYELFQICIYFDATDPRDKIYGLLGLIPPSSSPSQGVLVDPDYKNASLKDIYAAAVRLAISEGSLTVLKRAAYMRPPSSYKPYPNVKIGAFPSWVPRLDWAWEPKQGSPSSINAFTDGGVSNGIKPCVAAQRGNPDILRIRGVPFRRVSLVCEPFTLDVLEDPGRLASAIRNGWVAVRPHVLGGNIANSLDAFSSTICAGLNANHERIHHDQTFKASFARFMVDHAGFYADDDAVLSKSTTVCPDVDSEMFTAAAYENTMNRCLFLADNGILGLGPPGTQAGDLISILLGGDVPLMLREHGNSWIAIGDTYVAELMDGEYIASLDSVGSFDSHLRWFDLC